MSSQESVMVGLPCHMPLQTREAQEFGSSFWQKQEGIIARKRPTNDCNSTLTRGPGFPRVHHSTVIPPGEREKHHLHKNNKTTFPQTEAQVSVSVSLSLPPLTFLIPLSFFFPLTPPGQPPPSPNPPLCSSSSSYFLQLLQCLLQPQGFHGGACILSSNRERRAQRLLYHICMHLPAEGEDKSEPVSRERGYTVMSQKTSQPIKRLGFSTAHRKNVVWGEKQQQGFLSYMHTKTPTPVAHIFSR